MRRSVVLVTLAVTLAALVAGCGGDDGGDNGATAPIGTVTNGDAGGDAANGEQVFASAGCGSCHTLDAAGSSGSIGPNLDDAAPSFDTVVAMVTSGGGAMPSFEGELSEQEIRDVAAFVSGS
jgi:mono/diheme cytochrome c family protein